MLNAVRETCLVLQVIALLFSAVSARVRAPGYYETPLCGEGKRKCSESVDQCIEEHQICNGASDCDNSEDEKYCHCKDPGFIPCGAGIDDDCIPEVQFCDGNKDCKNGSDEKKNCCPHGYTRSAGPVNMDGVPAPCEDVNECLRFDGACSQHCNNTEGGYICSCEDGYDLVDNTDKLLGRTHTLSFCRATGDGMKIISAVHLSVPITFEPKHAGGRSDSMSINGDYVPESLYMIDIDFDIQRKKIFWCARKNKIMQTYLNSIWAGDLTDNLNTIENSRVILKNINCDSIAVDWVNQLIYFTSDTGSILVSDYNGQYKRAIIWSGLKRPRAIEVDPEYGILFYTDWGDELPHLGRANMDGSDRQELINNTTTVMKQIAWPNAMTIDHPNKHIYWMDAKLHFLECMKYDGSSRYTVTSKNQGSDQNKLGFPWKLRVFEDKVYWLDMPNEKILSANKFTGNSITEEWNFDQRGASIRIYHPVVQPPYLPRCQPNLCNQGLCLPVPNGYRCACQIGHTLLLDNKTCTIRPEAFAYVVMQGMIMKVALEPLEPVPQPITFQNEAYEETTFWSVDYHETWVYFNEYSKFNSQISIKRMSLEGQMTEILYKVVVNEKSKGGLSVDWLNGKIYWASSDSVSVGELDGSVHTTLIQKDGFKFSDILVDPCNGYIYLAVSERGIFRSSMDGDNASFTQLVSHFSEDESALPQPKGLTLDRDTNSLFFANKNVLYQARLNGSPLTAVPIVKRRDNINAVDLWGRDKIIWAETRTSNSTTTSESNMDNFSRVMAIQKLGQSNELQLVRENIHTEIFGIKVHPKRDTTCQPLVRNPCVDHACSHMCLQSSTNKDHVKGYRCVCPTGYALKKGSQTECADEIAQYLVYNPDNGIQTVSLDTHFLTPIKEFPNMTFKVTTFDIDAKNNLVYYCYGTPNKFEVRGLFDETGDATVHLPIHTLKCSGMVVEWVTNKLYIVDMGKTDDSGLILVVNLEKPYLMKHIVTELRRPLNIVVHPQRGKIYWILESHNIMSTNMDGTTVIESIVSYPASQVLYNPMTQMFIDFAEDHLYWTENVDLSGVGTVGLIKKVNLATKIVVQVHETKLRLLSGATIINDLIYFSDNKKYMYRIDNSTDKTVETRLLSTGDISYIRSSQSQPSLISNPCERNNGGCSDFCLLDSSPPYRCSCPTGIQLNDAHTCDTPHNNSLIVANATRINIMSLSSVGPAIDRVLTSKPEKLRAIDVDILMNKIYWSEIHNDWGAIWMLDMKTGETERIVSEDILVPNSIAVDMNAQNIFWIDSSENGKGTLEVMSLRTRKRSILKRYEDTSGRPQQIVLDPYEMLLFVSYPVVVNDVITRMWMNGNNEFGIQGDNLPTLPKDYIVSCLAIDLIEKRLYWSTADEIDHIASCDYKGQKRKVYNGLPSGITAQAFTILNRNIFVHHNPYAKVTEFRDTMYDGQIKETKEYNFYHLRGAMVSMKVGSIRVRADSPVCRPNMCCDVNMCTEKICIPTEIMAQCRCADDDVVCRENTEKEVESVPNYLPDNPDLCPDNFCSGKGTCVQFILPGSTSNSSNYGNKEYGFRCACDEGFSEPRCAKKKDRIAAAPWLAILILVVIIVIVIAVLWCHPKLCRNIRADHLRGESSEIDDTEQGEMEAKKLEKLVNKGIGRSYLRPNNHEQPV